MAERKKDQEKRAKIQCFLCSYAGTKVSNMPRHYEDKHDYDRDLAEKGDVDKDNPDGALCPVCGEHFVNKHVQIRHLLKEHSK